MKDIKNKIKLLEMKTVMSDRKNTLDDINQIILAVIRHKYTG